MKKILIAINFIFLIISIPYFGYSQQANSSIFSCISAIDSNERFPIYEDRIFRSATVEESQRRQPLRDNRNTFSRNRFGQNVLYGPGAGDSPFATPPVTQFIVSGKENNKEYFYIANSTGTFRVERKIPGPTFIQLSRDVPGSGVVLDMKDGKVEVIHHNNGAGSGGIGIREGWSKYFDQSSFADNFSRVAADRGSRLSPLVGYTSTASQRFFREKIEEVMNQTVESYRNQLNTLRNLTEAEKANLTALNLSNGRDPRSLASALLDRYRQGHRACASNSSLSTRANETIAKLETEFNSIFPGEQAPAQPRQQETATGIDAG